MWLILLIQIIYIYKYNMNDISANLTSNSDHANTISAHVLKKDLHKNINNTGDIIINKFNKIDGVNQDINVINNKNIQQEKAAEATLLSTNNSNYYYIKQKAPDGQYAWLSTTHITEVLTQYEKVYNNFYFLGAVPINFMEIYNAGNRDGVEFIGFPSTYINQLLDRGIKKFGLVINASESTEVGTHWASCYADITKGLVCFFDSASGESLNGNLIKDHTPDIRIMNMLNIFKNCFEDRGITTKIKINQVRHQYKYTECGVYSITFIIRMLNGESYENIINNPINDTDINKYRSLYFD